MKCHWGITHKLVLIFLLFAVVLLAGVGTMAYYQGRAILEKTTLSELLTRANGKEATLNDWLVDQQSFIAGMSRSPYLLADMAALGAAGPNSAAAQTAHDRLVAALQVETDLGHYIEISILDPKTGRVIASTDPSQEGKFREDPALLLQSQKSPTLQRDYPSITQAASMLTAAAPLQSGDGRLLGIIAGSLNLNEINAAMRRRTIEYETADAFLLNPAHLFVTRPNLLEDPAALQRKVVTEVANHCLAGNSGTLSTPDYRGVPAIIVYRWLPVPQLCLMIQVDQAEAFAPIYAFRRTLLVSGGLALVGAMLLAVWLAGTFTRPIRALQAGAVRFGRGDLEVRLPETDDCELGLLARAFNQMAVALADKERQLRRYNEELEQRVEERTIALTASEAELRAVFSAMSDVIIVFSAEGRYLKIAPTNPALLYKPPEEALGRTVHEVLPAELADSFSGHIRRALELGQPVNFEYNLSRRGEETWLAATLSPMLADTVVLVARDITQRKYAEQALQASENRYRTLANYAPVGIFETNSRGEAVFVNQYWCNLTGMTSAEALGDGWAKALPIDIQEDTLARWVAIAQSGEEMAAEFRFQTPAGKIAWASGKTVALRNEAGEITGYLGTMADITESKRTGEILSRRAAQLMLINDISSKIAAVLDLESVLDRAASLVQTTFDYHHVALFLLDNQVARLKAIAGSYCQYFPPDHTQELDQGIIGWVATHGEKVVANDVSQDPRYMSSIADKTITRAELCLPIKVADQVVGVLDIQSPCTGAFDENDIILMETLVAQIAVAVENARLYQEVQLELVERKQFEEALAKERNLMRTLIDNLPDLIFVKDTESRFVLVNQTSLQIGQQTMGDLIGKTDFEVNPPELAAKYWTDDLAVIQSGQALLDREECNISAGQVRWFSTTKVPLRDGEERIIGLIGMSRDITGSFGSQGVDKKKRVKWSKS